MAKYRITDNQSGKTLVINGEAPPSEQEAEQLFQESGIRGEQPQENKSFDLMNYLKSSAKTGAKMSLAGGGPIPTFLAGTPEQKAVAVAGPVVGAAGLGASALMTALNPATIANARQKIYEQTGKVDHNPIIKKITQYVEDDPESKEIGDKIIKSLENPIQNATDIARKMQIWEKAYNNRGDVRPGKEIYNAAYHAGKKLLEEAAPESAKLTGQLRFLYGIPEKIQQAQKATWLASKLKFLLGGF